MRYKVKVTPTAENDLIEIASYLRRFSATISNRYFDLIDEKINGLAFMPERHPLVKDAKLKELGVRFVSVRNYKIFFTIENVELVIVRRILYSRRDYEKLLGLSK